MRRRLGLTMRVAHAPGSAEKRDCLAQDWAGFLAAALPGVLWMPIPNLGPAVGDLVRAWRLDGFILTGGNDVGEDPGRDATEEALLRRALAEDLPVLGVCRGLQMLQRHFGGPLRPCPREWHVGVRHPVRLPEGEVCPGVAAGWQEVNSFHTWGVAAAELRRPLRAFAVTEDGLAEGIWLEGSRIAAVQWHPERARPYDAADRALVQRLFGGET